MEINSGKDDAVRKWMAEEGWEGTESAVWQSEPGVGFWAWRHHRKPGEPTILAIYEPVVRDQADLAAHLRLLRVADDLRRNGGARVWERGRITPYRTQEADL